MFLGIISDRKSGKEMPFSVRVIMILLAALIYHGNLQVSIAASNDTAVASSANDPFHADTISINIAENSLELIDNAIVRLGETIITADYIKAFFKKSTDGRSPFNESSTKNFEESLENVVARGNVNINSESGVAAGNEAAYDRTTGMLVLTGNPAILVNNEGTTSSSEIKADRIVFDEAKVSAEFTGNVSFTQGETFITADNLKAFLKGGVSLNGDSTGNPEDSVKKILAGGNVKIVLEDKVATGDEAVYDSATGKFVLTGDPATLVVGAYTTSAPTVEIIRKL